MFTDLNLPKGFTQEMACYPYIMRMLSNSGERGTCFSDILNGLENMGYRKKSIVNVLKFLKKNGKTDEKWVETKLGSAIHNSYVITLRPEYRTAIMVAK